ncbi:MAG TPA: sugar phosphate isomerase/epimerase [Anaerolineae bacterium]|nr:sugar phosphate isomerase/epimerase [Anaerolineae bacterium]
MTAPIALQLYTVREALARDFAGIMKQIADIGYVGVEPVFHPSASSGHGLPGTTIGEAARLFKELNLVVPSAHVPLPLGEDQNRVLDFMAALGCKRLISMKGPESFETMDLVKQTCDLFNEAHAVAAENGLELGIHNHWWEFLQIEGRYAYRVMLEHLDPAIFFQIDTYWVQTAGLDPAQVVRELGPRAPLLHIKDGPAVKGEPQVAVGDGVLDVPRIIQAAEGTAEWLIVELDHCATDMMEAVEKSYQYLVGGGFAHGNKG